MRTLSTQRTVAATEPLTEEQIKERLRVNELNSSDAAKDARYTLGRLLCDWMLRTGRTKPTYT